MIEDNFFDKTQVDLNKLEKLDIYNKTKREIYKHELVKQHKKYDYKNFHMETLKDTKKLEYIMEMTEEPRMKADLEKLLDFEKKNFIHSADLTSDEAQVKELIMKE